MADNGTTYTEEFLLKHLLGMASLTMPANLYVALHDADPTEAGNADEITGGSYARQEVTFEWVSSAAKNDAAISFTDMPSVTVSHWSIRDHVSAGNALVYGAFDDPIVVTVGSTFQIPDNELSITLS